MPRFERLCNILVIAGLPSERHACRSASNNIIVVPDSQSEMHSAQESVIYLKENIRCQKLQQLPLVDGGSILTATATATTVHFTSTYRCNYKQASKSLIIIIPFVDTRFSFLVARWLAGSKAKKLSS